MKFDDIRREIEATNPTPSREQMQAWIVEAQTEIWNTLPLEAQLAMRRMYRASQLEQWWNLPTRLGSDSL